MHNMIKHTLKFQIVMNIKLKDYTKKKKEKKKRLIKTNGLTH